MFEKYDSVRLKSDANAGIYNVEYAVIWVRGFWIFRSYDIEGYDGNYNKITQEKVFEYQLEEIKWCLKNMIVLD